MTVSPSETSLLSHKTPRFRYFKPLMRVSEFELSLSLQNRPQDLTHRLGPRTGTNPDFELFSKIYAIRGAVLLESGACEVSSIVLRAICRALHESDA